MTPTLPPELILNASVPLVETAIASVLGKNTPVFKSFDLVNTGADDDPLLDAAICPLDVILRLSEPPSAKAIVSDAGKNKPVFKSPIGAIAGFDEVPVPVVIKVVDMRLGIVPVVIVAPVLNV